jgi:hypothetical protein
MSLQGSSMLGFAMERQVKICLRASLGLWNLDILLVEISLLRLRGTSTRLDHRKIHRFLVI